MRPASHEVKLVLRSALVRALRSVSPGELPLAARHSVINPTVETFKETGFKSRQKKKKNKNQDLKVPAQASSGWAYQCSTALSLHRHTKSGFASPAVLAKSILDHLPSDNNILVNPSLDAPTPLAGQPSSSSSPTCTPCTVSGPGFLNLGIKPAWIADRVASFALDVPRSSSRSGAAEGTANLLPPPLLHRDLVAGIDPAQRDKRLCLPLRLLQAPATPVDAEEEHIETTIATTTTTPLTTTSVAEEGRGAKRILVDFSSPNIAKEMHVGHLRSTVLGECLARVLGFVFAPAAACAGYEGGGGGGGGGGGQGGGGGGKGRGVEVLKVNHVGDFGTQFGMLIALLRERGAAGAGLSGGVEGYSVSDLQILYREAKAKFDVDAEFKGRARACVLELQGGGREAVGTWKRICDASREGFSQVYSRLDIEGLKEVGESFYASRIPSALAELEVKGLLQGEEEEGDRGGEGGSGSRGSGGEEGGGGGALFYLPAFGSPLVVRKEDGGATYASTDLAALRFRAQELQADWLLYVTDSGQASHFSSIFQIGLAAHWIQGFHTHSLSSLTDDPSGPSGPPMRCSGESSNSKCFATHVGFGLVKGDDGKRIRTRAGDSVRLVDLLDEAKNRCLQLLRQRKAGEAGQGAEQGASEWEMNGETASKEDEVEVEEAACKLAYGSVRYFDLQKHRESDYNFSYDSMLDLRGNTALYCMYSLARLVSVMRKLESRAKPELESDIAIFSKLFSEKESVEPNHNPLAASCPHPIAFTHDSELRLCLQLIQFHDAVAEVTTSLEPHHLCNYLHATCSRINEFYRDCPIISCQSLEEQRCRIWLCGISIKVVRQCFSLLGINPVDKL